MKITSILSLIALSTLIFGCQKDQPESSFTTDKTVYKEKHSIQFENTSENGISYYWNFGDGESSTLKNPGHTYTETGEYIVTLQVQGAKKTTASEFSTILTIVGENSNITQSYLAFTNTTWTADSTTRLVKFCSGESYDYSTNEANNSMVFKDDNTVLMMSGVTANLCEFEILNDTLIGFYENPYYRLWAFHVDEDRLTLTQNSLTPCDPNPIQMDGELYIQHFYKN